MDLEQLQELVFRLEARIYELEAQNTELNTLIWNHPKFAEQEERMTQLVGVEFARYAEDICVGLNHAFKSHFENDEYEISEAEFYAIIANAQRLPF